MMQAISDSEAIGRIRGGDTTSYDVLATRYHRPLYRVAQRLLRSTTDAEDVVQRAHLLALTHIHQYAGTSGYFPWMYSIVVNEARTHMRKGKRVVNISETHTGRLSSPARSPEQQAVDRDVEHILERAVASLPAAYQPVFRLREIEDLSTAETGRRLGLTSSCVKSRLFRAKKILRRKLGHVLKSADLARPARDCAIPVPRLTFSESTPEWNINSGTSLGWPLQD